MKRNDLLPSFFTGYEVGIIGSDTTGLDGTTFSCSQEENNIIDDTSIKSAFFIVIRFIYTNIAYLNHNTKFILYYLRCYSHEAKYWQKMTIFTD